jgi:phage tail sheath protein FI
VDTSHVSRDTARAALNQIGQRELAYFVFEVNVPSTWAQDGLTMRGHLVMLWCKDILEGRNVQEAFFIRCDHTTMTQEDLQKGTVICLVGMAPERPWEIATFGIRIRLKPRP